jgi:hypothetical protein
MIGRSSAVAALMVLLPAPAAAETWRASSRAEGAVAFIDVDSIRREGDRVSFWREVRWPEARALDGGLRFDRIGARYEGDCRTMTLRSMAIRAKLDQQVVLASEEAGDVETAEPGSTAEIDLRSACFGEWPAAN